MLDYVSSVIDWVIQITEQMLMDDTTHILPILFACGVVSLGFDIIIAMNRRDGYEVKEIRE